MISVKKAGLVGHLMTVSLRNFTMSIFSQSMSMKVRNKEDISWYFLTIYISKIFILILHVWFTVYNILTRLVIEAISISGRVYSWGTEWFGDVCDDFRYITETTNTAEDRNILTSLLYPLYDNPQWAIHRCTQVRNYNCEKARFVKTRWYHYLMS